MNQTLIGMALWVSSVVLVASPAWSQSAMPSSQLPSPQLMGRTLSAEEAQKAGLGKLSAEELAYLNAWLTGDGATESAIGLRTESTPATSPASAAVAPGTADPFEKPKLPPRLVARILPPFTGWEGGTEFRLDNGQVWRQRLPGRYVHQGGLESPTEVLITRNMFGFFVLTVPATGRGTGVERLR